MKRLLQTLAMMTLMTLTAASVYGQKIQAEDYIFVDGAVQEEPATDSDGSVSIGYFEEGDKLYYSVNLSESKSYKITFRIASLPGGTFIFGTESSGDLLTIQVPETGGWFEWTQTDATVDLPAGNYNITLSTLGGVNINWLQLSDNDCPSPGLTTLIVEPEVAEIIPNGRVEFAVKGIDGCNVQVGIQPIWSVNAPNGVFKSNGTEGDFEVVVQSDGITKIIPVKVKKAAKKQNFVVNEYGRLQVINNKVASSRTGSPVSLAGNSLFWSCSAPMFWKAETIDWLVQDFNTQVIRAATAIGPRGDEGKYWNDDVYMVSPDKVSSMVETVVKASIENDIYVIIDFHEHHAIEFQQQAIEFFGNMAKQFGDYDNIIYEIFNEPIYESWGNIKAYADAVIAAIRQYDNDNLVVVGTPFYSQKINEVNPWINDVNVAYVLHPYADNHYHDGMKHDYQHPLMITEWGMEGCNARGWDTWFKQQGYIHTVWSVFNKQEGGDANYSLLLDHVIKPSGWTNNELSAAGKCQRDMIRNWITLRPAPMPLPVTLPARIEAEHYWSMSGVTLEACSDNGAGQNVGYFDPGDYLEYNLIVPVTGTYALSLRLAGKNASKLSVEKNGSAIQNVSFAGSGDWQAWETIETTLTLQKGEYKIRLTTSTGGVNVNWINIDINVPPVADAGADAEFTLPTSAATLTGSGTDAEYDPLTYSWKQVRGPNTATIINAASASTSVTGMVEGTYVFELTVSDGSGRHADQVKVTIHPAGNIPPIAEAGTGATITLPISSSSLSGSGTDADGDPLTYSWTQSNGPNTATITQANAAATSVTGLQEGTYVFTLTVYDGNAQHTDSVTVIVNPAPNYPPVAHAGDDIFITLPVSTVTLSGTATDQDGDNLTYSWKQKSGPNNSVISSPISASTVVTGLTKGSYTFVLTVDDGEATHADQVLVIVKENVAPVANAGNDVTITLPLNAATLTGGGTDADGDALTFSWQLLGGPNKPTIVLTGAASTVVTGLMEGTYMFTLTVSDGIYSHSDQVKVTVRPKPNTFPVADAGSDVNVALPANSASISGSGTDADGDQLSYGWIQVSGPNKATITNASAASATVSGLVEGSYVFKLTVTDGKATHTDQMTVTVYPPGNVPPVANAGSDIEINLPASTVSLSGKGNDMDGDALTFSWTQLSGPNTATIANAGTAHTSVSNLTEGTYVFRLSVHDGKATDDDDMTVRVSPRLNRAPVVFAGADINMALPYNKASLNGTATDADDDVLSYSWIQASGPSAATFSSASGASTNVSGLKEGTYVFELTVNDGGLNGKDRVTVTVYPPGNVPPVVETGLDLQIRLPQNYASLIGVAMDADGDALTYFWEQLNGPNDATITEPAAPTTGIEGLIQGTYVFKLTVDDGNASDASIITITVESGLSVEEKNRIEVKVFPNPVIHHHLFVVLAENEVQATINLYALSGQIVRSVLADDRKVAINVSDLEPGLYLLDVSSKENKYQRKKIIVK